MAGDNRWYLEYHIAVDRPGLLGDIASLVGALGLNILTISGVDTRRRGLVLEGGDEARVELLAHVLDRMPTIRVTALRRPTLIDILAIRHGRYIEQDAVDRRVFRFTREELGILVNFLGELMKGEGRRLIGLRGVPRTGKTEAAVAAAVYAGKRWVLLSASLFGDVLRTELDAAERAPDVVYLVDAILTVFRGSPAHRELVREVLQSPHTVVVEHPDVFVEERFAAWEDFQLILELRNAPHEEIRYDVAALQERYARGGD
ncbi:MAG: ACT domain protein [Brockia lithotrophica]|uniref:ACT domain protein n=1 Tax=Brockia lithotrophica TaxID=933949 RepID=A0A2T5G8N7_9BACL|nr:DUF3388 domain-containing protein [Brockia lithotrophica]PTQ52554.1 MAG: ACT domain protein [Brockia lithotrophica]